MHSDDAVHMHSAALQERMHMHSAWVLEGGNAYAFCCVVRNNVHSASVLRGRLRSVLEGRMHMHSLWVLEGRMHWVLEARMHMHYAFCVGS